MRTETDSAEIRPDGGPRRRPFVPPQLVLHGTCQVSGSLADSRALVAAGLSLVPAVDRRTFVRLAQRLRPECVVVDAQLLSSRVLDVLRALDGSRPVSIVVNSPPDSFQRATLINSGVDDCLSAPYCPEELVARVVGLLRRRRPLPTSTSRRISSSGVTVDLDRHVVEVRGALVSLTAIEFSLLVYLMAYPNTVVSAERLLADVWGYTFGGAGTVPVHVRRLRIKIEVDPARPQLIETVRGAGGYRFNSAQHDWMTSRELPVSASVP